jgi:hypothetical protein
MVEPRKRARLVMPIILAVVLLGTMVSRGRLEQIRTVDALSLFAAGLAVGVAIVNLTKK